MRDLGLANQISLITSNASGVPLQSIFSLFSSQTASNR